MHRGRRNRNYREGDSHPQFVNPHACTIHIASEPNNNIYIIKPKFYIQPQPSPAPKRKRKPTPQSTSHRPNCFFSKLLKTAKLTALNAKASSNPTSPPYDGSPIRLPMGPMNHTCDMPMTAPKMPKQNARTAAMPGGRRRGLFQMAMSYLRCLKTKCSVREMPS